MRELFRTVIKDSLTVANGRDYCESKMLAFVSFWIYLPFAGYMLYRTPDHFSLSEFSLGIATIIGAGAVGAKIKDSTEPE